MKKTQKGKHESGDTAWEEATLRVYRKSEMRLVDMEVHMCKDADRYEHHCHTHYGEVEDMVEDWFLNHQDSEPDLHNFLCIDLLKVCCPANHYGTLFGLL